MGEDNFVPAIDKAELKDGTMKPVKIAGRAILLARIGAQVFAVSNICPCRGCPLSKGKIDGYIITCPCHGWKFDVQTGKHLKSNNRLMK
jgi:3-phenylpropionate/trans-cinnamate dioxygenase ferredoxin subunit